MRSIGIVFILLSRLAAAAEPSIESAAAKAVPGVTWRPRSVVAGDFTCRGQKEQAILGTTKTEIVIAVFLNGTNAKPEVLRYSTEMRDPAAARIKIENLDYDPKDEAGASVSGFQRSKTCKGLNLSDGKTEAAHIYWNHESKQFNDWVP